MGHVGPFCVITAVLCHLCTVSLLFLVHGYVCFESVENRGQYLGAKQDRSIKPPGITAQGDHGQFYIIVCDPVSVGREGGRDGVVVGL